MLSKADIKKKSKAIAEKPKPQRKRVSKKLEPIEDKEPEATEPPTTPVADAPTLPVRKSAGRPRKTEPKAKTNRKISPAIALWQECMKETGCKGAIRKGTDQYARTMALFASRKAQLAEQAGHTDTATS